jgi:hypothetical protein
MKAGASGSDDASLHALELTGKIQHLRGRADRTCSNGSRKVAFIALFLLRDEKTAKSVWDIDSIEQHENGVMTSKRRRSPGNTPDVA